MEIQTHVEKFVQFTDDRPLLGLQDETAKTDTARLVELVHVAERVEDLLHVDRAAKAVSDGVPSRTHRPDKHLALEVRFFREAREDRSYLWAAENMA